MTEKLAEAKKIRPKIKWKRENAYKQPSNVKINVYGVQRAPSTRQPSRAPASIVSGAVPGNTSEVSTPKDSFENTLTDKYKQQMRHNDEVNHLIDQLKNYEQDYKKNY